MNKAKQDYLNVINEAWGSKEQDDSPGDSQIKANSKSSDLNTSLNDQNVTAIPISKLEKLRKLKLTKTKQAIFLNEYANTFNISKASYKAGISRQTVYQTMKVDDIFKKNFQDVKDGFLDQMEQSSVYVAQQPDARGFNDRKLQLTTHRPETYAPRPEIQTNIQVNIESTGEVKSILSKILPND